MISGIVKNLKSYARDESDVSATEVDANEVVHSSIDLCGALIRQATRNFTVDLGEDLPPIKVNPQQIKQVIVNLLMNACQALSNRDDKIICSTSLSRPDSTVSIVINDEGAGIAESDLSEIFKPFFTTKRDTGGTGLGLAICKSIVDEFGGDIVLESEIGIGTTACVRFPAEPQRGG